MRGKTTRLTIKVLNTNKAELERIALVKGEPVAVIVRQMIREGILRAGSPPIGATQDTVTAQAMGPHDAE